MFALAFPLGGCNFGPSTYEVTGKVTYRNSPVAGANVIFTPVDSNQGKPASGTTDAEGIYRLSTYLDPSTTLSGALPGEYRISVSKMEAGVQIVEDYANFRPPANLLPAKYADSAKSGLEHAVGPGANQKDLNLVD